MDGRWREDGGEMEGRGEGKDKGRGGVKLASGG